MQYSPKLKKAMEQIKKIVDEHDIAAHVVLHTPGFTEYLNHITPSYSCAKLENENIRIRAKAEDFGGDVKIRNQKLTDTVNMISHFSDRLSEDALSYIRVSEMLDKITGAEHGTGNRTSHNQQNN
jgi:hypothetical protein